MNEFETQLTDLLVRHERDDDERLQLSGRLADLRQD